MDLSRFTPEASGTPDEPRPDRWPTWWWSRAEISSNTHRSFGHQAPRTRGWLHLALAVIWPVMIVRLALVAEPGTATFSAIVFGLAIQAMLSASALFHLKRWDLWTTELLFRFDHTGIFLAIGGTTTPVAMLSLDGWQRVAVLGLMWGLTIVGIIVALWPAETPVGFGNTAFIGGSLLVLPFVPSMFRAIGAAGVTLLLSGGATYIIGATLLAFQRPRLSPRVFGYHEVWHVFVVAAMLQHAVMIERYVLPLAT